MSEVQLVKFDSARRALAEAHSIDEVKDIRDKMEALRLYLKQQGEGLEMQNQCAEIKLRAERKAGELIIQMKANGEVQKQGDYKKSHDEIFYKPKLGDMVERNDSHRFQLIASLPEPVFETEIETVKAKGQELTTSRMLKVARRRKAKARQKEAPSAANKAGKPPRLYVGSADNMSDLEAESVDIIITSPPYNLGRSNWRMGADGRTHRGETVGYDIHNDVMPEADYQDWQIRCLQEMYRVARQGASLFYNHKVRSQNSRAVFPHQWLLRADNPWVIRQEIWWDRTSTHNHNADFLWPHDERVFWMVKGDKPNLYNESIGIPTIWRFHGPKPDTWHPAPFPDELPRQCLNVIGGHDLVVLDPFAGSCTTLKVALSEFGFDAVGYDISENYLERAKEENGW